MGRETETEEKGKMTGFRQAEREAVATHAVEYSP